MNEAREKWWKLESDDLAKEVWRIATGLQDTQKGRTELACSSLSLYEGLKIENLRSSSYMSGRPAEAEEGKRNKVNISRTGCNAVVAEIAGRQKPTAKCQTHGGNWATKRKARRLEKFIEGCFRQRHGQHRDFWDLGLEAFLDSTIFEWGGIKFSGIPSKKDKDGKQLEPARILAERVMCHEWYVDPLDARYGCPGSLFHVFAMDRDLALWLFCENPALKLSGEQKADIKKAIEEAKTFEEEELAAGREMAYRASDSIKIVESWRRRLPSGQPGKHVFCLDGVLLAEEEWGEDGFPLARMLWARHRWGWSATALIEEGRGLAEGLSENFDKLTTRFRICGAKRTYIYEDALVDENDMQRNDDESIIKIRTGREYPQETSPSPVAQSEVDWMITHYDFFWKTTRISEMKATSRKEPGIEAGVALRYLGDMQSNAFSPVAKNYEMLYVESAEQFILRARELAAMGENPSVYMDEEIDWKSVELPENSYEITVGPASGLPNDVAGRIQLASELKDAGILPPDVYVRLIQLPDLEVEMNQLAAQHRYMERRIDEMLDATTREVAEKAYKAPDTLLINKGAALLQVSQAYFNAMLDEAPEFCLDNLRKWVVDLGVVTLAATPGATPGATPAGPGGGQAMVPPGQEQGAPPIAAE